MPLPPAHLYFPLALLFVGALFTMLGTGVKFDIFNWSATPPIQRAARLAAAAFGLILMAGGTILAVRGEAAEPSKSSESSVAPTPAPTPTPRPLQIVLPNNGDLPDGNIDIRVPDADLKPGESLWTAVRHVNDHTWYLYPCAKGVGPEVICSNVTVGASATSPGPWDVAGVIVNEDGRTKILDRKRRIVGGLPVALGTDLVGFGSAPAHR